MPWWKRNDFKVGDSFEGSVAWCADPTSGAQRAAFYPTQEDGTLNFELPLEWVEERPDDPDHTGGHWRVVDLASRPHFNELPTPNVFLSQGE